jgi:hypothetical protein
MNDEATAERLGLSTYDLVMLIAQECGLIPVGYDDAANAYWGEREEQDRLAYEAWYEAGRND